ncbi:MAG: SDR family NAD(P)-dependent oxidoreductase [Paracoccus sp. (in: a-proteobacteria)]
MTMKTILITGASTGIGRATAELFFARGWNVVATMRTPKSEREDGRWLVTRLDVTDAEAWDAAVRAAVVWTGRLDVLVNNAGIINRKIIRDMTPEEWRRVIDVNLTGAFLGIRAAAPAMTAGGSIVNISSNSAFSGHYDPAYTASKWALRGLTRTAAMEYADVGIRVNAICPGLIVTDLNRNSSHLGPMIGLTPLARAGEADEVAQLVLFLASDASGFITGEDFVIDGGFTAGAAYRRVAKDTGIL